MTPFLAFFNGREAGVETGDITASKISWTVTSNAGYEIDGILFEKDSTLAYTATGMTANLSYDNHTLNVEASIGAGAEGGMAVTSCIATYDGTVYDATAVANAALSEMFPSMI